MIPEPLLRQQLIAFLEEDLHFLDISSQIFPADHSCSAEIICKRGGILAGALEAQILFQLMNIQVMNALEDGTKVQKGDILMTLQGPTRNILSTERTALNILHRMSAIATTTKKAVLIARKSNPKIRIAATRKTTPGFRLFEKRAIILGGGDPHRWTLDDMVLLKDTHKALFKGDIPRMLEHARELASFTKKIEVEVENQAEALSAVQAGADIIMFDNMVPKEIVAALEELERYKCRTGRFFEASGGISLENIDQYAATGVDVLSIGSLTMAPSEKVDFSLEIKL